MKNKRLTHTMRLMVTFLMIMALPMVVAAGGEVKEVLSSGVGMIQGENLVGAKQEAVQDALRQAVEQGVGMLMDATTIIENDEMIEKIYINIQGYVESYEILQEKKSGTNRYRVKVKAMVKTGEIKNFLIKFGLIRAMIGYPRVLFLADPAIDNEDNRKSVEGFLVDEFVSRRFEVVDLAQSKQFMEEARGLFKVDIVQNVAARLGMQHHAEVVVIYNLKVLSGRTESSMEGVFGGLMESVPVSISTRAVVSTTAQILTSKQETFSGIGRSKILAREDGIRKTAKVISEAMANDILNWWSDFTANGLPFVVKLKTRAKDDLKVIEFQEFLQTIPGVVSVTERSSGGGLTEMMVKYKFNSAEFKKRILLGLKNKPGFQNLQTVLTKGRFLSFSLLLADRMGR